ncbi:MAG: type II secretion system GspH family protein [Verrucomicrobia bacterium]|nr:type II secretion system GspH family protein [Verrucomicrobiota bacterium]
MLAIQRPGFTFWKPAGTALIELHGQGGVVRSVCRDGSRVEGCVHGFTLIELLVVIAIIGILAGLLMSVLGKGMDSAKAAECLSNLRQWGVATQLFVTDNNGYLPKDGSASGRSTKSGWYVDLPKAMGLRPYRQMPWHTNPAVDPGVSVWICPANPRRSNGKNLFHYCLNRNVNGAGAGNQVRHSSISMPSRIVWLFDNGGKAPVAGKNNVHTNLHNDGAQILFLDGHAEWFRNVEYWDFEDNTAVEDNPDIKWTP